MASSPITKKDPLAHLAMRLGLRSKTSTKYTRNRDQRKGTADPHLTLQRLFTLCFFNEPDSTNSRYVRIFSLKTQPSLSGNQAVSTTLTRIPGEETRAHQQIITSVPDDYTGKISKAPGIKVWCDCPRHQYMWDYALFTVGASDGLACQGIPSHETNPTLKLAACKHICRLAEVLISRGL